MSSFVRSNGWNLIAKPRAAAFRGVSGKIDPALLMKAEARKGYVAVYVVGERGGNQVRIGIAANPAEVFKTAQQWNWREIDVHGVLWTPGKRWAEDLKKAVERELSRYLIRGSWYEMEPQMVINTVVVCAQQIKAEAFELFNDETRYLKYEAEIEEAIRKRNLSQRQAEQAVLPPPITKSSGKVIHLTPRPR